MHGIQELWATLVYPERASKRTSGLVDDSGCGVPGAFFWLPARVCVNDGEDLGVNPTGKGSARSEAWTLDLPGVVSGADKSSNDRGGSC